MLTPIKRPEIKTTKYVEMDSMAMASIANDQTNQHQFVFPVFFFAYPDRKSGKPERR